jgi:hypothetical protein
MNSSGLPRIPYQALRNANLANFCANSGYIVPARVFVADFESRGEHIADFEKTM